MSEPRVTEAAPAPECCCPAMGYDCAHASYCPCADPPVAVPGPASEPERYTISEERLAEIRALIAHDRYGYQVLPASAMVTALELAAAVDDLLAERDERTDA